MKSSSTLSSGVTILTVLSALNAVPSESFEIHTEELISHSVLARLILESPTATRQKKSSSNGMAFLAEKAVEPQVAFLTDKNVASTKEPLDDLETAKDETTQRDQSSRADDATNQVVNNNPRLDESAQ